MVVHDYGGTVAAHDSGTMVVHTHRRSQQEGEGLAHPLLSPRSELASQT